MDIEKRANSINVPAGINAGDPPEQMLDYCRKTEVPRKELG